MEHTTLIDFDGGANPVYIGNASVGSATTDEAWQIKKITWSGSNPTEIKWADGTPAFVKIWDDRASYTYS